MKVENLRTLSKVIQLCRSNGVTSIKIDGIEMQLSLAIASKERDTIPEFPEASIKVPAYTPVVDQTPDKIETDELTEDQLLYYSARPESAETEQ